MSQLGELGFSSTARPPKRRGARGGIAVVVALIVVGVAGWFAWDKGKDLLSDIVTVPDYTGTGTKPIEVEVRDGDSTRQIAVTLKRHDVVKSEEAFNNVARDEPRVLDIQPGYYQMRTKMSGKAALSMILDPNSRILDQVTVQEGLRTEAAIKRLSDKTKIDAGDFREVLKAPDALGLPSYAKGKAEGFLFPARYDFDPGTTAESMLRKMVDKYDSESRRLKLVSRANDIGRTPLEIVTIASLIEAEVRQPEDYPKVSRVIYNRLADREKLRMDSTVHYANKTFNKVGTSRKERENPSPYNTYVHTGLPPGPINAPGARALEAALNPAKGDWYYFVTVDPKSGRTLFASTYEQHQRNVQEYRKWCHAHLKQCRGE